MEHVQLATLRGRWNVEVPTTHRERSRGLRARPAALRPDDAMLFLRCRSIHTVGMRFPIAAVTLDASLKVLEFRLMPPRRLLLPRRRVRHILECDPQADLRPGDRLRPTPGYTLSAAPYGRYARE